MAPVSNAQLQMAHRGGAAPSAGRGTETVGARLGGANPEHHNPLAHMAGTNTSVGAATAWKHQGGGPLAGSATTKGSLLSGGLG